MPPRILIAGAGIAGLALAQGLLNHPTKKFKVIVFEKDAGPQGKSDLFLTINARWQGHHIQVYNYGAQALLRLLPPHLIARLSEVFPPHIENECPSALVIDESGKQVVVFGGKQAKDVHELAQIDEKKTAWIMGYRPDLRNLLLDGVDVRWSKQIIGYEESENGVRVCFADGTEEVGDVLIGADGVNSIVRSQKFPNSYKQHLGVTVIPTDVLVSASLAKRYHAFAKHAEAAVFLGPDGHTLLVTTRLHSITQDSATFYRMTLQYGFPSAETNYTVDSPADVVRDITNFLMKRKRGELTDVLLELWKLARTKDVKVGGMAYVPPVRRALYEVAGIPEESKPSRVTLLGDSICGMSPFRGQAANIAFQDAVSLCRALDNYEIEGFIRCIGNYETEIRPHDLKAQIASRYRALEMTLFGLRKWPVPILKPLSPFIIAATVIYVGVWKLETAAQSHPPYDTDPRNPKAYFNSKLKKHHGEH
ncbi:6142_t:CDS:2 [Paraglomus occultum]|uniref:6142_t:CDS:1 n=1 Tax=Paraglomus occultum TaxID=144539 RepID=A0A9N9BYL8_9GLOM|nr:6142_t:CDS:2 [Paraglomus occultum]